ncbi:MAG: transposase [Proteobacteria bacterium]|nr:transposase [Pseudomonadota bacterium]
MARRTTQLAIAFRTHGGKRAGAGRPPQGPRSSEPHKIRARFQSTAPVHVVMRVVPGVGRLRTRAAYRAIRTASAVALLAELRRDEHAPDSTARDDAFRIVHLSIQATHLHAIVEASDQYALARGLQAFQSSAARRLNRALGRHGQVFADRYFATRLTSPRQVRNTLAYVLNNWRHHAEDRGAATRTWVVDPFSTALHFDGWQRATLFAYPRRATYQPLSVWLPRTWLLRVGWRRHHARIGTAEIPGGTHAE